MSRSFLWFGPLFGNPTPTKAVIDIGKKIFFLHPCPLDLLVHAHAVGGGGGGLHSRSSLGSKGKGTPLCAQHSHKHHFHVRLDMSGCVTWTPPPDACQACGSFPLLCTVMCL